VHHDAGGVDFFFPPFLSFTYESLIDAALLVVDLDIHKGSPL